MRAVAIVLCCAFTLFGCDGCGTTPGDDAGPPDASTDGGADAGSPECTTDFRTCSHRFAYPFNNESRAEVHGSFNAWGPGVAMHRDNALWVADVQVPWNVQVQYKFVLNGSNWLTSPYDPTVTDATGNTNNALAPFTCAAWGCDLPSVTPPGVYDWRDSVIYFVFVDRFANGNAGNDPTPPGGTEFPAQYQGGDWQGVIDQIDGGYFNALGVNTLWLTVPFQNADTFAGPGAADSHLYTSYHGYWPKEVDQPEPAFGSLTDLQSLVTLAHARGLKVLFDYAMVHVHDSSTTYAAHPDWFWPNAFNGGNCICGQGCDWNAQGDRCWFASYLPHWNYTVPAARAASVASAVQWVTRTGVDGFRLDAIKHVDQQWMIDLRAQLATQVHATQNPRQRFYLVGETYDFFNQPYLASFVDPATKLDGQFDFPLRRVVVEAMLLRSTGLDALEKFMGANDSTWGPEVVMSTWLGNHDLPRIIHLAEDPPLWADQAADGHDRNWANQPSTSSQRSAYEKVANAFALLFTTRGAPLIYYGDELGMAGAGDPDNRRFMQWSGLSADQQWLRERLKALLAIRAAHPALRRGKRVTLSVDADVWVYRLVSPEDEVFVVLNRSDVDRSAPGLPSGTLQELLTSTSVAASTVTVPARQARIYVR